MAFSQERTKVNIISYVALVTFAPALSKLPCSENDLRFLIIGELLREMTAQNLSHYSLHLLLKVSIFGRGKNIILKGMGGTSLIHGDVRLIRP